MSKEIDENQNTTTIIGTPDKGVPKFCTDIKIQVSDTKNFILTLLYATPGNTPVLIEQIVIDQKHAENLAKTLQALSKKTEIAPQ